MTTETVTIADLLADSRARTRAINNADAQPLELWLAYYEEEAVTWEKIWEAALDADVPEWAVAAAGIAANHARSQVFSTKAAIAARERVIV